MLTIKVLGPGCDNCKRLAWLAERAATHLGVEVQIIKVTEYAEMMQYNIMSTEAQITTWVADALEEAL
jgi:Thioredoxin domain